VMVAVGLFILGFGMPACKDDAPVKPKASLTDKSLTFKESDGEIDITVVLDKPAAADVEIAYTLTGTAIEQTTSGPNALPDYQINTDHLIVKIPKGGITGIIKLELYSDSEQEQDETIILQLEAATTTGIDISGESNLTITLKQEDGLMVVLAWGVGPGENYTDVDMDLFLWAEGISNATLGLTNFGSLKASVTSPESFFLPSMLLKDGSYGLSCNYYSGSADPMNFKVSYTSVVDGAGGLPTVIPGTYTLTNLNEWDKSGINPILIMTFKKTGTSYSTFSNITVPSNGSRVVSVAIPPGLLRKGS